MRRYEAIYTTSSFVPRDDTFPLLKSHCYTLPDFRPMVPVCRTENSTYYPGCRASVIPSGIRISESATPRSRVTNGVLLTHPILQALSEHLPVSIRSCSARSVFRLTTHGTTMSALLRAGSFHGPYIMLIQTKNKLVGAFLSDCLCINAQYYGRPSMFVFEVVNKTDVTVYKQTRPGNTKFMSVHYTYGDGTEIFIGHNPAIYLVDQFMRLYSHPCETYGSPSFVEKPSGDKIWEIELCKLV